MKSHEMASFIPQAESVDGDDRHLAARNARTSMKPRPTWRTSKPDMSFIATSIPAERSIEAESMR